MKIISVIMRGNPDIKARPVFPDEKGIKDKIKKRNKNQFKACKRTFLEVIYEAEGKMHQRVLSNTPGFIFDGASIPFGIGKGDMRLLVPALWHDWLCREQRSSCSRKFASLVFKELLLKCGIPKIKAQIMYSAVEMHQMITGGWGKDE